MAWRIIVMGMCVGLAVLGLLPTAAQQADFHYCPSSTAGSNLAKEKSAGLKVPLINRYITYVRDAKGGYNLENILGGDGTPLIGEQVVKAAMTPVGLAPIHFGTTNDVFWFHLPVRNCQDQAQQFMLMTNNVRVSELAIYQKSTGEAVKVFDTSVKGATVRMLQEYGTIAVPFTLLADETVDFYIRFKAHNTASFPLEVQTASDFSASRIEEKSTLTAIISALITIVVFNAVIFIFTKMKVFYFYILIELASLGYLLHHIGWTTAYIWGDGPFDHLGAGLLSVLATMMIVQFNRYYFDTKDQAPFLDRVLAFFYYGMTAWCLLKLMTLVGDVIEPVLINAMAYVFAYPSFFVVLGASLYFTFWGKKSKGRNRLSSFLIFTAWLILVGNIMVIGLRANNLLPDAGVSPAIDFGYAVLVEALIVSFALSMRIRSVTQEREELMAESLSHAKREQQLLMDSALANQSAVETGRLILSVGHDSQQMMAAIRNYADILMHDTMGPRANKIGQAVKDSTQLLMDVLKSAMIAGDRRSTDMSIQAELFKASHIFDALNLIYKQTAREQENQLTFTGGDVDVYTDRVALMRILGNFISNSNKYTYNGSISVSCRLLDDVVAFDVTDTGVGMSKQQVQQLFSRKFEMRQNNNPLHGNGSGVGLQVCKELADQMNSAITVDSEKGAGTRITLSVPRTVLT